MKRMRRRRMQKQTQEFPILMLTSLLDVALTLVVMLIVAAPNINNGLRVALPYGKMQEARNSQPEHTLTVQKNGSLFWNKKEVTLKSLMQEVQKDMASSKNKIVFVRGDKDASYGTVMKAVADIKEMNNQAKNSKTGGIEHVVFVTTSVA